MLKALGPGIVYAGAAIGVSYLVQSTRAGAGYGFVLVWAVLFFLTCFSILFLIVYFAYGR